MLSSGFLGAAVVSGSLSRQRSVSLSNKRRCSQCFQKYSYSVKAESQCYTDENGHFDSCL